MKGWTRVAWAHVALAGWTLMMAAATGASADETTPPLEVELEGQLAFRGYHLRGALVSARIEVRNRGPERRVKVSLRGASSQRTVTVDLTRAARKQLHLTVPTGELGAMWVEVTDAQTDKRLAYQTLRSRQLNTKQPLLVFVGDRPPGLKRLGLHDLLNDDEQEDTEPKELVPTPPDPAELDPSLQARVARARLAELPEDWLSPTDTPTSPQ
ncbi:MAG: hypothetical protein AAFX99_32705, partial [Myxococcota bacterium]